MVSELKKVFWVVLIAILAGCSKDELTEPVTVTCLFNLQGNDPMDGLLQLERVDLNLSKVDIGGRRTNENDMYFTRRFEGESGNFELLGMETPTTKFQIPQGTYETLVFYLSLREEEYEFEYGSSGEDDETGDLREYITVANPGMLLVARYSNETVNFPVIISLNDDLRRLALDVTQITSPVKLQKEVPAIATITFDPSYWFSTITPAMLEGALSFPLDGEEAVVISDEYNTTLYNQIVARLEGSATITLEDL